MTTVGFGDITVSNPTEAIVLTLIILLGCLVLSYNIAQVGNILQNFNEIPGQVRSQLSTLRRLVKANKVDWQLHNQIGEYIVHAAEIKKTFEVEERNKLIEMLPSQMR